MGTQGFRRVTLTHQQALVKRYRAALGELAYWRRQGTPRKDLEAVVTALAQALRICAPDLKLHTVRPLRYVVPAPVTALALQRAVLAVLRESVRESTAADVSARLLLRLPVLRNHETWLTRRLSALLPHLADKGWISSTSTGWRLK